MKTEPFVTYSVCKMRDKENTIGLTVEQYEDIIGMLAYFGEIFDVKIDVTTIANEDDPEQLDVYINHKVVVY